MTSILSEPSESSLSPCRSSCGCTRFWRATARLDQFFDCSQHRVLVEPVIAHVYVGPRHHLQLAGVHHLLHIYACLGQSLQMLFPLLGIHNVGSLFPPVDAILIERAEHSVLLVDGIEESADMVSPGEIHPGEFYGMFAACHMSPQFWTPTFQSTIRGYCTNV